MNGRKVVLIVSKENDGIIIHGVFTNRKRALEELVKHKNASYITMNLNGFGPAINLKEFAS